MKSQYLYATRDWIDETTNTITIDFMQINNTGYLVKYIHPVLRLDQN